MIHVGCGLLVGHHLDRTVLQTSFPTLRALLSRSRINRSPRHFLWNNFSICIDFDLEEPFLLPRRSHWRLVRMLNICIYLFLTFPLHHTSISSHYSFFVFFYITAGQLVAINFIANHLESRMKMKNIETGELLKSRLGVGLCMQFYYLGNWYFLRIHILV
jgi:hypothetical protein